MSQIIIHENETGGLALCVPSEEALQTYTITEIGLKDVTTGKPFWIIDRENIPEDMAFFNSLELDLEALGEPDGYGIDYEEWVQEYRK